MEGKIYVITHKKVNIPMVEGRKEYVIIQTADEKAPDLGYLRASVGEDTLKDNQFYAEIGVFYWIWKNVKCDYVGISQYHRFFYYHDHLLTGEEVKELLQQYDILVPEPRPFTIKTVEQQWNACHFPKDLSLAAEILEDLYPEYRDSFQYIMKTRRLYTCNMFIANKAIFDEYCKWLLPILKKVRERINLEEYPSIYYRRVGGFLSERLFNVWVYHNKLSSYELELKVFPKYQFDARS